MHYCTLCLSLISGSWVTRQIIITNSQWSIQKLSRWVTNYCQASPKKNKIPWNSCCLIDSSNWLKSLIIFWWVTLFVPLAWPRWIFARLGWMKSGQIPNSSGNIDFSQIWGLVTDPSDLSKTVIRLPCLARARYLRPYLSIKRRACHRQCKVVWAFAIWKILNTIIAKISTLCY